MLLSLSQKQALATELAKPAYAGTSDAQAAVLLNATPTVPGPAYRKRVPIGAIQTKVFELGLWAPLVAASRSANATAVVTAVVTADTVMDFFAGPHLEDVDMDKAKFREMLGALKQLGITTDESEAAILGLADARHADTFGPTPFQALAGLGNVPILLPNGDTVEGTCYPEMVAEARS